MKIYYFAIFILLSFQAAAQQPETVLIKKKIKDEDGYKYKVKYYALKTDTSVKHGYYERYDIIKSLEETGFYKYDVKDSTWRTYIIDKYVGSIGEYENGKKNGEWKYYTNIGTRDPNYDKSAPTIIVKSGFFNSDSLVGVWNFFEDGILEQQYDYSLDSLIYPLQIDDNYEFTIKTDSGIQKRTLDRPPLLLGGSRARIEHWKKMNHGELYTLSNGQDNVSYMLSFWIKSNGETIDYEMIKGVNEEYDNYIIDYYKENYEWFPGVLNGVNIECQITVSQGYVVKR